VRVKRHGSPLGIVIAVVLALGLVAPSAASARVMQTGIADDAVLLGGGPDADEAVDDWAAMGVDTVRIQVNWARIAPAPTAAAPPPGFQPQNPDDPGYNWGVIDGAMARLARVGIKPILMIDGPPPLWGSGNPSKGNPRYRPSAAAYANFAAAVATRYGGAVDEYILWNEPNLPLWLQPQADCGKKRCTPVSPNVYRAMVRAAYPAIHAVDPVATVLIGALAPAGAGLRSDNANMRPLEFLRGLGCFDRTFHAVKTGGCRGFKPALADGISYHPHSTRHAPSQPYAHPDNADIGSLGKIERLLDRLQRSHRLQGATIPLGLWLDEYGYQTNPPDKLRGVSPGAQDRYLQQAAYIAWHDPRVVLFAQYLWKDEPAGDGRKYTGWQSGLHFADGSDKPALAHFPDPIWVDFRSKVAWGQVRPGGVHSVAVQRRIAGGATNWETLAVVQTDTDGSWQIPTAPVPFATYRSIAEDGTTSAAMIAVPPAQASEDEVPGTTPDDTLVARRAVGTVAGAPIPRSFAGFSMEYWAASSYLGATRPNPIFARLVQTLAKGGNGAPTIRVGGNSTDETWWNPGGAARPAGVATDVTPAWLSSLRTWTALTRTPMMLGLNLALHDPANAAAYAQAAFGAVPPGLLAAFEVGNEPDLYTQPRTFRVGSRVIARGQRRATGYAYGDYRAELQTVRGAVEAAAPGAPLAAGGFASAAWEDNEDDVLSQPGPRPIAFSAHTYALHTCDRNPHRTKASFANALLGPNAIAPPVARMAQLAAVAATHGSTFRVSEMNSANCGGVHGASDALASALWGTDALFALADAGVRGVNFHTFTGAFYAPVDFGLHKGHFAGFVRPLFYGMLLFDRATPRGARLLAVGPNPSTGSLKTWGTVDRAGTRRVVVINKSPVKTRRLVLRVPGGAGRARVQRLVGPSITATRGITFGGRGYGDATTDGKLRGKARTERVARRGGAFRIDVAPASAALVTIRRG
jgi:Glycosyl hydrolase family 79 C-terminal beta domain